MHGFLQHMQRRKMPAGYSFALYVWLRPGLSFTTAARAKSDEAMGEVCGE